MNDQKDFGLRVSELRKKKGLSKAEVARRADLNPNSLSFIEKGERNLSLKNIIAIARGLGCSPKDLMPI